MTQTRPLSPALAQAAKKELHEDPSRLESDIHHLREWMTRQPHIRGRTDDQFLVAFLRGSKFSLERAKEKLDSYYSLRSAIPEFFANRDPTTPLMEKIGKLGLYLPLGEDFKGRRVILLRVGIHDPNELSLEDILKYTMMIMDTMILEDDVLVVKGVTVVLDHQGMTMGHIKQYMPSVVQKAFAVFQNVYPMRQKAMHYYHMPAFFETVFNFCKSLLKEKIRKRVYIESDLESLFKEIPKEILPAEYGGEAGSCAELAEMWLKKIADWKDYFAQDVKYGVDERKRRGKANSQWEIFGVEGSFRSLNVD